MKQSGRKYDVCVKYDCIIFIYRNQYSEINLTSLTVILRLHKGPY